MGRGGAVPCPTCRSSATKTIMGKRASRLRRLADDSILRAHKCEDCGQAFLSRQRALTNDDAEEIEPLAG